jgi:flavin-dependent dehydrogenase
LKYEVIIAGASFGGLAVASSLKKRRVLLIDRKEPGTLPTSACAAPLPLLEKRGVEESILQVVENVIFKTAYSELKYKTLVPFANFDYTAFCQKYLERFEGEFIKANILDFDGRIIVTDKGDFRGKVFIDATGWRAKLASSINPSFVNKKRLGFGLETEVLYSTDELYFIFDPKIIKGGYAWIFPIGEKSRFGLGSYGPSGNLLPQLKKFTQMFGLSANGVHGGFMPYGLRPAVLENIFLVGDSAGQIVPLTGEGIRQAIYFGEACAQLIERFLEGEITLTLAKEKYQKFVSKHRQGYLLFFTLQKIWQHIPNLLLEIISQVLGHPLPRDKFQEFYFNWMVL